MEEEIEVMETRLDFRSLTISRSRSLSSSRKRLSSRSYSSDKLVVHSAKLLHLRVLLTSGNALSWMFVEAEELMHKLDLGFLSKGSESVQSSKVP